MTNRVKDSAKEDITPASGYFELDSQTCGRIALHVYQQYKESLKSPSFQFLSFEDWVEKVIEYHDNH
jgi:hypothetical protein